MKYFALLLILVGCGETNIKLTQGQDKNGQCLDVRMIDNQTCFLESKTYSCGTQGSFKVDMDTVAP